MNREEGREQNGIVFVMEVGSLLGRGRDDRRDGRQERQRHLIPFPLPGWQRKSRNSSPKGGRLEGAVTRE